jgi:ubiquinone/menaquinone biosynthesis C-methylase UbiE
MLKLRARARGLMKRAFPVRTKNQSEMSYWRRKRAEEPEGLHNDHYEYFYTEFFGLSHDDYRGKAVLDIGCGPRGSLEWADVAGRRVGLDPLVNSYRELGIDRHKMEYIHAGVEKMPVADGSFDIVCSFNNLDHVDNLQRAIREIKRVTKIGGLFLLITEIEHRATVNEPHSLPRDIASQFGPEFTTVSDEVYGVRDDHDLYRSLRERVPYEPGQEGIVCAKMLRQG